MNPGEHMRRVVPWVGAAAILFSILSGPLRASSDWLKEPSLSPDGTQLVVRAAGDIYLVQLASGQSRPLIATPAFERSPRWSPDGRQIAYASDTAGGQDVYVLDVTTGSTKRLTYHERAEVPSDFVNGAVLFTSTRRDLSRWRTDYALAVYDGDLAPAADPRAASPRSFSIGANGAGAEQLFPGASAEPARLPDGRVVYTRLSSTERPARRRFASDARNTIWLFEPRTRTHQLLHRGPEQVWSPISDHSGLFVYFLRDEADETALWRVRTDGSGAEIVARLSGRRITGFTVSAPGRIVFEIDGELYDMGRLGIAPRRLDLRLPRLPDRRASAPAAALGIVTAAAPAVAGGHYAVVGGHLVRTGRDGLQRFALAVPHGRVVDVTSAPTGDVVILTQGSATGCLWRLREDEKTAKSARLDRLGCRRDLWAPQLSPNGKHLLVESEARVLVWPLEGGRAQALLGPAEQFVASGAYGQKISAQPKVRWLPDGSGVLFTQWPTRREQSDVALIEVSAEGTARAPVPLVIGGYDDIEPLMSSDGRRLYWRSNRGGDVNPNSAIVPYGAYVLDLPNRFVASARSLASAWSAAARSGFLSGREQSLTPPDWKVVALAALPNAVALLRDADRDQLYIVSPGDAQPNRIVELPEAAQNDVAVYHWQLEDIWALAAPLNAGELLALRKGELVRISLGDGRAEIVTMFPPPLAPAVQQARQLDRVLYLADTMFQNGRHREPAFDHAAARLRGRITALRTHEDFAASLDGLLGELGASHTHFGLVQPPAMPNASATLGFVWHGWDSASEGYRIGVLPGSPLLDLEDEAYWRDAVVLAVDERPLRVDLDPAESLINLADRVKLRVSSPAGRAAHLVSTGNLDDEWRMLWKRWVGARRELAGQAEGEIVYAHLPSMGRADYRRFFGEVMAHDDSENSRLVVDTRYNQGGWLHESLVKFLSGRPIFHLAVQGGERRLTEPALQHIGRSVMIVNGGNYSNGSETPRIFSQLGLGEVVGESIPATGLGAFVEMQEDARFMLSLAAAPVFSTDGHPWEGGADFVPAVVEGLDPNDLEADRDPQLLRAIRQVDPERQTRPSVIKTEGRPK